MASKSPWSKTPVAHLVRYEPKGTYYLRARVGGKIVRESLKTDDFTIAKIKVGERLSELRAASGSTSGVAPKTFAEALAAIKFQVDHNPNLRPSTKKLYDRAVKRLLPGGNAELPTKPLVKVTRQDMEVWWNKITKHYSPQVANTTLMLVRRVLTHAKKAGGILRSPADELSFLRIPRTRLDLPSVDQFHALVERVRNQPKSVCREESANWVEFMAYSGMRPGEIRAVKWEHIHEKEGVIMVYGGEYGTKNGESRPVPIIPPMADLLRRMRESDPSQSGSLFSIKDPSRAFKNACKREGIDEQRLYNLRHLFATTCRDSGVPVPTFAEWLGHKDGGALAMRTYVQKSNEHTKKAAQLVNFT